MFEEERLFLFKIDYCWRGGENRYVGSWALKFNED